MDPYCLITIVILVILLILSAFFSSAETALTGVSEIRIRTLAEDGNNKAKTALKLINNKDKMLSAILIGNNIVNLSASALTTKLVIDIFDNRYISVATGILTFLILVFGEITPKTLAAKNSKRMALFYARVIYWFVYLMTPFIFVVNGCAKAILRLFKFEEEEGPTLTEEDIKTVFDVSHEEGILENDEHEMLHNLVDFGDTKVKDVMVPKVHVTFVDINSTYDELMEIFKDKKHTRYPVYEEDTDKVVGIINIKDILLSDTSEENFSVKDLIREAHFTFENKNTVELFSEMRKNSISVSVVLDEYGLTSGFITIEDLLEEIVGEIHDEYDEEEEDSINKISGNKYVIEGSTPIVECNDELGLDIESEDYDSIGGYIIENLDKMPEDGDAVYTPKGDKLIISKLEDNRIDKVFVQIHKEQNKEEE